MGAQQLKPASELAQKGEFRFPNESEQYRRARTALLAEEIELRRHIERVAEQRRAAAGRDAFQGIPFRGREWPCKFIRAVRRQADARGLQLHVRSTAPAALPDVHLTALRVGRRVSKTPNE